MSSSTELVRPALLVCCALVANAFLGCGSPDPAGEDVGQTGSALTANDQTAFDYFLAKGLTNYQAAGIVGNLDQESGMDPTAVEGGGPGRGIAQWSVGGRWDTDSGDNLTSYAAMSGQSIWSLQVQLDFIWFELTTFQGYGLAALRQSTNVTDATIAFETDFEGCGTCDQTARIAYAQTALSAYGSDSVDAGAVDANASGGDAATSCSVPALGTGECVLTTACAALPDHVSTPGYCPGPADIECCTGPADDAGAPTPQDSGALPDSGPPAAGDSGHAAPVADAGSASHGDAEGGPAMTPPPTAPQESPPRGASAPRADASGCSMAPGHGTESHPGMWLLGLALVALRRRKLHSPDDAWGRRGEG